MKAWQNNQAMFSKEIFDLMFFDVVIMIICYNQQAKGQPLSPELVKKAAEWEDFITACQRKKMEIGVKIR